MNLLLNLVQSSVYLYIFLPSSFIDCPPPRPWCQEGHQLEPKEIWFSASQMSPGSKICETVKLKNTLLYDNFIIGGKYYRSLTFLMLFLPLWHPTALFLFFGLPGDKIGSWFHVFRSRQHTACA